ncbi:MAG: cell wall hydrolase [Nitrospirae bacterium]|jgi:N-acetylmuramoyl-L-alanine amidase|nr:cell wall hydrolase [Nitrospirota bacterium]
MVHLSPKTQGTILFTTMVLTLVAGTLFPQTTAPALQSLGLQADASIPQKKLILANIDRSELANPLDETLAALTVYLEARGESFAGKMAVAAVIRNRMKMKYQSDGTIRGTVLRRSQFQPWNKKSPHQVQVDMNLKDMKDSLLAWRLVQDGRNVVDGAVLFFNPRIARTPRWARVGFKVASIGGHEFYIPKKHQT